MNEPNQLPECSGGTSSAAVTTALLLLFSLNAPLVADPIPPPPPRDAKAWEGLENLLRLLADPDMLLQKPGGPKVIREAQLQDRNGTWFEINQEKPFTGKVLGFFQNRQKRIESDHQEGLLHGVQTLWFDNGQQRQLTHYEKGRMHGAKLTWYRDGQKASETLHQKGKRHGIHRSWHFNGKLAEETSYLQGEPHGLARRWHDNGKIAREVRWERGRQLAFDTWTAKGERFGDGTNTVSMLSASYKLNVHDDVAQVEAEFKLSARLSKQKFTLFREIIAVDEFSSSQAGAKLLREGPELVLYLPEDGEATVKMKFLIKHAGDATKRTLGFGIPSSLTSKVDVVLQEDDSEVEMPTAVTYNASSDGNQTMVEAVIGASDRLELTWKPRVKKAKEIAATVFVQNASTISFGNGVVQARVVLDYTVSQGEMNEVKAALPDGWKLMKVEGGKTLRTYFVNTEGGQSVLTAQLEKGVSTVYQLILELEQTLVAPPVTVKLSLPRALGVKRETGFVALQSGEELGLTVSKSVELLQVDAEEFTRNTKQAIRAGAKAYGYSNPEYTLAAEVETILPEIEATAWHLTAISEEQLRITTQVNYSIKRVGVFKFRLRLPAEATLRVKSVTGSNNPQWEEKTVDGARLLLVTLKQRTKGTYPLRIELVQPVDALPEEVSAVGVHPLDVTKLTNHVGIYAEEGVVVEEIAESKSDNLKDAARFGSVTSASNNATEQAVAPPSVPANANALAYWHLDEAPGEEPGWNLTVATKALEPWVRNAQLVNWIKLGNTRLTGRTRVRYEIERAPARRFTLILPATINTNLVKFEGANIRSHESRPTDLGNLYTITLQDKVRPGQVYQLTIDWELSEWDVDENGTLEFQGPVAQGENLPEPLQAQFADAGMDSMVEGEEGWLVVSDESRTQLMISPGPTMQGLEKKNTGDLPDWAKDGSESARLVYYYFRPGYQLAMEVKRLEDAAVEPAWISQANFNSVATEDGQMMTRMTLEINNHGKQFLAITLPGVKAEVLSVFVNGQARRPTQQGEQFLVPLENSSELGPFPVEVTYSSRVNFPRMSGRVELLTPRFDVKLNNANWWLYLPRDYAYSSFEGSMNRTDAQAISERVGKLDTNKDGRLDQEEMGKDMQLGEILNNEDGQILDLAMAKQANPRSGAVYDYDVTTYKLQEMGNTQKVIDNIARQQAIVESNFNADNLSAVNRYNDQSIKSINQLSGVLRGKDNVKYYEKLKDLQANQRKLESKRRNLQVQQEQFAQQDFAFRNAFKPQQWAGQTGTTIGQGQAGGGAGPMLQIADKETVERQKRQIDEIDRIQKRVTTGEVTPLNINLPRDGVFLAFSQPLQTETDKPMTISFTAENTRRTSWWIVLLWSSLGITVLFSLILAVRRFALRKPALSEG